MPECGSEDATVGTGGGGGGESAEGGAPDASEGGRLLEQVNLFAIAAAAGNLPALQLLLDLGAGAGLPSREFHAANLRHQTLLSSALFESVDRGHMEIVRELIVKGGADVNATLPGSTLTALHVLVSQQDFDPTKNTCWRLLLTGGAVADTVDLSGQTLLHHAAKKENSLDLVRALMASSKKISASLSSVDDHGKTPLHYALQHGQPVVCQLFLKLIAGSLNTMSGANLRSDNRHTLLHAACKNKISHRFVAELIRRGADPDVLDDGLRPLHHALSSRCCGQIVSLLVSPPNVKEKSAKHSLRPVPRPSRAGARAGPQMQISGVDWHNDLHAPLSPVFQDEEPGPLSDAEQDLTRRARWSFLDGANAVLADSKSRNPDAAAEFQTGVELKKVFSLGQNHENRANNDSLVRFANNLLTGMPAKAKEHMGLRAALVDCGFIAQCFSALCGDFADGDWGGRGYILSPPIGDTTALLALTDNFHDERPFCGVCLTTFSTAPAHRQEKDNTLFNVGVARHVRTPHPPLVLASLSGPVVVFFLCGRLQSQGTHATPRYPAIASCIARSLNYLTTRVHARTHTRALPYAVHTGAESTRRSSCVLT